MKLLIAVLALVALASVVWWVMPHDELYEVVEGDGNRCFLVADRIFMDRSLFYKGECISAYPEFVKRVRDGKVVIVDGGTARQASLRSAARKLKEARP